MLILANKQDLPNAMKPFEIAAALDLSNLRQEWHIQASNAVNGDGLYEGLEWLKQALG